MRARLVLGASTPTRDWRQVAAAIALLLAGAAGGLMINRATSGDVPAAMVRQAEGPKFMLMFAEDPAWQSVPPEERARHSDEFMRWLRSLGDHTIRLGGTQLDTDRGRILGASTPAVDPALMLTGFIVIRADSYEEAVRYAETCPLLARGGQVIVRGLR